MSCLFSRYRRRPAHAIGVGLAVFAFCLRLVAPAWVPPPVSAVAPAGADLIALFGEHALCIAAARGEAPPDPGDQQKTPAQEHDCAFCCLWHTVAAIETASPAPPQPTAFGLTALTAGENRFTPLPRRDRANARAPPTLA